ncbi:MAG: hypothetical protein DWP97_05610 [Calditrichaeota bacterium]|nr:MAG: hypothetical protein DWP97_05610 [Calditrichota bacterium]
MTGIELFQLWLMAFVTLALFSFMYKDNPIYRIAEHIFAGLTAGYQVGLIWDTVILQQLWNPMIDGEWWLFIPGILGFLMFTRFSQKFSWISRMSLAFVMGVTAGIFIISQLHGLVLPQMQDTMIARTSVDKTVELPMTLQSESIFIVDSTTDMALLDSLYPEVKRIDKANPEEYIFSATYTEPSDKGMLEYYAPICSLIGVQDTTIKKEIAAMEVHDDNGIELTTNSDGTITATYSYSSFEKFNSGLYQPKIAVKKMSIMLILSIIIVIGVVSTLIYFYFSHEHVGALGVTAKVGIWFIMISFGAHFGYTVMGRVSLLIGRVQFLVEDWVGSFNQLF